MQSRCGQSMNLPATVAEQGKTGYNNEVTQ
jgi:hypothetical protein